MATLQAVRDGLTEGRKFKRPLSDGGFEYVKPCGWDMFAHTVIGESNGGWGGYAELPISYLESGRWESNGWIEELD